MGRFLKQYDKEKMKLAMLKHEETFRQQVHELHRLYRVQKLLMRDMKNMELRRRRKNMGRLNLENQANSNQMFYNYQEQRCHQSFDRKLPAEAFIKTDATDIMLVNECEADLELTLATGSSSRRNGGERSHNSDSGASFSSSSTESGIQKHNSDIWRMYLAPDLSTGFRNERKIDFAVEERMTQDRIEHSPWLFQCLSLKMT